MEPETKNPPAETPWTSVAASKASDPIWEELAALGADELRTRVEAAVKKARATLHDEAAFGDRVHDDTLSRTIG